jgi:ADP-heptose:LPS heptosyltransferase
MSRRALKKPLGVETGTTFFTTSYENIILAHFSSFSPNTHYRWEYWKHLDAKINRQTADLSVNLMAHVYLS